MKLHPLLIGLSICWLCVTNLLFIAVIFIAVFNGGVIQIDFNLFHEMYIELALSLLVLVTYPFWWSLSIRESLER